MIENIVNEVIWLYRVDHNKPFDECVRIISDKCDVDYQVLLRACNMRRKQKRSQIENSANQLRNPYRDVEPFKGPRKKRDPYWMN